MTYDLHFSVSACFQPEQKLPQACFAVFLVFHISFLPHPNMSHTKYLGITHCVIYTIIYLN